MPNSPFHVGAARTVITPPLGTHMQGSFENRLADDVHDELYAKAIVLQNDNVTMAIVVCDLIGCYEHDLQAAKERAAELTGIPAENIFISCTHTHYGPNTLDLAHLPYEKEYTAWAMQRVGDSVKLAVNRLVPARFGHASASCPEETHNRRWRMRDGSITMSPADTNPDRIEPAGPTDPEIVIAAFVDENEKPIAVLCNYSLHYVGSRASTAISANYFGAFERALQRMAGADFVAIMANGCCGDINNIDCTRPPPPMDHPHQQVERVARVIATRVHKAWQEITEYDTSPPLDIATTRTPFRRREYSPSELDAARDNVDRKEEINPQEWAYAVDTLKLETIPVERDVIICGIRIGSLGITGMPGEMFVEYGLQTKAQSPFERTMTIELANGFVGYCPTDVALDEGGYETRLCSWAMAAKGTERMMVDAAVDILTHLKQR